jgi:hypothetical protein
VIFNRVQPSDQRDDDVVFREAQFLPNLTADVWSDFVELSQIDAVVNDLNPVSRQSFVTD